MQHLAVEIEQSGMQLDEFLARAFPGLKKSFLRGVVRSGRVRVNGEEVFASQRLRENEVISVDISEDELADVEEVEAEAPIDLPVLFENQDVIAIDKPSALPVEPERWETEKPNLMRSMLALSKERGAGIAGHGEFRPRLVHRLDKDTSGVVLIAKTLEGEQRLREAFDSGAVKKEYLALVEGEHPLADGARETIDFAIGPDARKSGAMRASSDGKEARTDIEVAERFHGYTLLRCFPRTGRTHQIRVHLAAGGFPLAVDPIYGRRKALKLSEIKSDYKKKRGVEERPLISRLTLHAASIEFSLVPNNPPLRVESPIPEDFARVLRQLAKVRPYRR